MSSHVARSFVNLEIFGIHGCAIVMFNLVQFSMSILLGMPVRRGPSLQKKKQSVCKHCMRRNVLMASKSNNRPNIRCHIVRGMRMCVSGAHTLRVLRTHRENQRRLYILRAFVTSFRALVLPTARTMLFLPCRPGDPGCLNHEW